MRLITVLLILLPVFLALPAPSANPAHAQAIDCLMVVDVLEIKPLVDRGDAVYGLWGGDMEFQFQIALTNGNQTWEAVYPGPGEWRERVHKDDTIKTDELFVLVDMNEFLEDQLYIYFVALDLDPLEFFGYDFATGLENVTATLLSQALRILLPQELHVLSDTLVDAGIESLVENVTEEDIIGQGGFFIDAENGWGTREIQVFETPDEGLEIRYQIRMLGENCSTDLQSA